MGFFTNCLNGNNFNPANKQQIIQYLDYNLINYILESKDSEEQTITNLTPKINNTPKRSKIILIPNAQERVRTRKIESTRCEFFNKLLHNTIHYAKKNSYLNNNEIRLIGKIRNYYNDELKFSFKEKNSSRFDFSNDFITEDVKDYFSTNIHETITQIKEKKGIQHITLEPKNHFDNNPLSMFFR